MYVRQVMPNLTGFEILQCQVLQMGQPDDVLLTRFHDRGSIVTIISIVRRISMTEGDADEIWTRSQEREELGNFNEHPFILVVNACPAHEEEPSEVREVSLRQPVRVRQT